MLSILILPLSSSQEAIGGTSFQLRGVVHSAVRVKVLHGPVADSLDLTTSQNDLKIVTIKESAVSRGGIKVTISSVNNGVMVADNLQESVATHSYEIKYNGRPVNLSHLSGTAVLTTEGFTGKDKDLTISYSASRKTITDSYSDTVKLTYAAN